MANYGNTQNGQANQGQQNKWYTFFQMVNAFDPKTQNSFFHVVLEAYLDASREKLEIRELQSGNKVVNISSSIDNRSDYIQRMTNGMPDTDGDGRTWATISFWDRTADRLVAFASKHPNARIIVVGTLTLNEYTGKDGMIHRRVNISCNDFMLVKDMGNNSQSPRNNGAQANNRVYGNNGNQANNQASYGNQDNRGNVPAQNRRQQYQAPAYSPNKETAQNYNQGQGGNRSYQAPNYQPQSPAQSVPTNVNPYPTNANPFSQAFAPEYAQPQPQAQDMPPFYDSNEQSAMSMYGQSGTYPSQNVPAGSPNNQASGTAGSNNQADAFAYQMDNGNPFSNFDGMDAGFSVN